MLENDLEGGFFISAQSGENVLTTFYKVAAATSGITLTAHELAFTEKARKLVFVLVALAYRLWTRDCAASGCASC